MPENGGFQEGIESQFRLNFHLLQGDPRSNSLAACRIEVTTDRNISHYARGKFADFKTFKLINYLKLLSLGREIFLDQ
jgi:predicted XRE-type DNA-binding protein